MASFGPRHTSISICVGEKCACIRVFALTLAFGVFLSSIVQDVDIVKTYLELVYALHCAYYVNWLILILNFLILSRYKNISKKVAESPKKSLV